MFCFQPVCVQLLIWILWNSFFFILILIDVSKWWWWEFIYEKCQNVSYVRYFMNISFFSSPPFITNQSPFYTHTHVQLYSRTLFSVCCVESFLRERERKREVSLLFSSIIIHISIIAFISIYIIYWDSLIGHPPITYTHTNVTWEKFS